MKSLSLLLLLLLLLAGGSWLLFQPLPEARPVGPSVAAPVAPGEGLRFAFVDVAPELGVTQRNRSGHDGQKNFILEAMPPGVAVGDFDNDGWMDLYLPNGNNIVRYDRTLQQVSLLPETEAPRNALYWNQGGRRFEEGGAKARVDDPLWAFGALAGDLDNDGWTDLYVCNWGVNRLYRNRQDGTFEEIGVRAGAAGDPRDWSTGACLIDYDRDGDLDIYVAQYADVHELLDRPGLTKIDEQGRVDGRHCDWKKLKVYCGPLGLRPLNDLLLKNLLVESGELRFEDVSAAAGIHFAYTPNSATEQSAGPFYGFQPVAWDIDGDGWQDIFVANDSVANNCWMNRGDGTFEDRALAMSLAMSMSDWNPQASMGVAVGDINQDGLQDLVMTEFSHDQFNLLMAQRIPATGMVVFDEKAPQSGLRELTFKKLGWGAILFDPDCDGDLDMFFACGHVYPEVDNFPAQETTYRQYNLLVHMLDAERLRFEDASSRAGPGLAVRKCSRAAAVIDFDNDGDPDLITTELNDTPCLLRCDVDRSDGGGHWLALRLRGNPAAGVPLDPVGAVARVSVGGVVQSRVFHLGSSFQSSEDPRQLFGLGGALKADWVEVLWPNGTTTRVEGALGDRLHEIACPLK